jgi:hypothetical protein
MVRNQSLAKAERLWHKPMIFKYEFIGIEFLTNHIHKEQRNRVKAERFRSFGCPNQFHPLVPKHQSSIDIIIVMLLRAKPQQYLALSNISNFLNCLKMVSSDSKIIIVGAGVFRLGTALWLARDGYKNITILIDVLLIRISTTLQIAVMEHPADINKVFQMACGEKLE